MRKIICRWHSPFLLNQPRSMYLCYFMARFVSIRWFFFNEREKLVSSILLANKIHVFFLIHAMMPSILQINDSIVLEFACYGQFRFPFFVQISFILSNEVSLLPLSPSFRSFLLFSCFSVFYSLSLSHIHVYSFVHLLSLRLPILS